jgi:hypothetical protein
MGCTAALILLTYTSLNISSVPAMGKSRSRRSAVSSNSSSSAKPAQLLAALQKEVIDYPDLIVTLVTDDASTVRDLTLRPLGDVSLTPFGRLLTILPRR